MLKFTLVNDMRELQLIYTHVAKVPHPWLPDKYDSCETGPGGPVSPRVSKCVSDAMAWFSKNFHAIEPLTVDIPDIQSFYMERDIVKTPLPSFRSRRLQGEIVFNRYAAYKLDYGQAIDVKKIISFRPFVWPSAKEFPFQIALEEQRWSYMVYPYRYSATDYYPQYDPVGGGGLSPNPSIMIHGESITRRSFDESAKKVQLSKMKHKWDVQSDLVTDCVASLNGKTLDLLTTLAELPETVKMIYDILKRILLLLVRFKKEARKKALALLNVEDLRLGSPDTYAKLWLEYRYGILPLMYTVEDALKVIEKLPNEFIDERKKKVITRPSPIHQDIQETLTHRCLIRRRLDISSKYKQIQNQLSLNPFVTAWELIPLSFVVDWVLTIGNFLGALSTPDGVITEGATYSVKTECNGVSERMYADYEFYERIIINPQSHISIDINPQMSADRWRDLVSLVKVILMPAERKKYQLI